MVSWGSCRPFVLTRLGIFGRREIAGCLILLLGRVNTHLVARRGLPIWASALLRLFCGARKEQVLRFAIEPLYSHVDVAANSRVRKVYVPFEGL